MDGSDNNIRKNSSAEDDTVEILDVSQQESPKTENIPIADFSKNYRPVNDYAERRQRAEPNTNEKTDAAEKYRTSVLLAAEQRSTKKTEDKNKIIFFSVICAVCIVIGCISGTVSAKIAIKNEIKKNTDPTLPIYSIAPLDEVKEPSSTNTSIQPTVSVTSKNITDTSTEHTAGSDIPVGVAVTNAALAKTAKEIYNDVVSSVVGITSKITISNNLFGQSYVGESSGSGFILSEDGYILTNYHVIEGGSNITVSFYDGTTKSAEVVGYDSDNDVAVLKTDAKNLHPAELGDSDDLSVGDTVLIIGNPLGKLSYTLTSGVVSALNRKLTDDYTAINMFQTDAAVNSGNSGGPAFNMDGEVVGIVTSKYADSTIEGLSFCIPMDDVKDTVSDIIHHGYAKNKPLLGVSVQTLTSATAARYNLVKGAYIVVIGENEAAEKAGLKAGDVITKIDDTNISTITDLKAKLGEYKSGDEITVTYYREGAYNTAKLKLDEKVPRNARTSYSNVLDL